MSEVINKLQPDRTIHLRGFDRRGSAAALHHASPTGFEVTGVFRDQADFAVLILWDADDFFEHYSIKYLPDFDFTGMALTFDLHYQGLQPIDSPKYNWIDWATLDCISAAGQPQYARLFDNAMLVGGTYTPASGVFHIQAGTDGIQPYDRLTLWLQNLAFDFIAPLPPSGTVSSVEYQFFAAGTGTTHAITIGGLVYSHNETNPIGESSADQAAALVAAINAGAGDPQVIATIGSVSNAVQLAVRPAAGARSIAVSATDGNAAATLYQLSAATVAATLAESINQYDWAGAELVNSIMAAAAPDGTLTITAARAGKVNVADATVTWTSGTRFSGLQVGDTIWLGTAGTMAAYAVASVDSPTQVTLASTAPSQTGANHLAPRGGNDGNMVTILASHKTDTLTTAEASVKLRNGSSDATWRVTLDFTALGIDQLRQAWLTFAPALADSAAFADAEWSATFSNWTVSDPQGKRPLRIAGPGSVRVGSADSAVKYPGTSWAIQAGFFNRGFCRVASTAGDSVTVKYYCQQAHDLYVGTSLYRDRGIVSVSLDGDTATSLDCYLNCEPAVQTRRKVRASVAAGDHVVTITLSGDNSASTGTWFYFDFLDAVIPGDVQPSSQTYAAVAPALDYDTDHGYKLSPQRLIWNLYTLGIRGSIDEYIGVFWWNQRKRVLAPGQQAFNAWTVTLGGTWAHQDAVYVAIGDPATGTMGKSVFPSDNSLTIAQHFAAFVNETYVGVWAAVTANSTAASATLTITTRTPIWGFTFTASAASTAGTVITGGDLNAGDEGQWAIDDSISPALNRAATDWHADLFREAAARGLQIVSAISMELVNPPDEYAARFHDGTAVLTDTGFQSLKSTQCTFAPAVQAYQTEVCKELAALQAAAGLPPWIQFGEFLWWFFDWYPTPGGNQHAGMAFYDAYTTAQALAALGRPLAYFDTINDDPSINGSADANFLRVRIKAHIDALRAAVLAATPGTKFELLYPYDVNYPVTNRFGIGGRLNHYVNLPAEYTAKATSGLDRFKMEALSFTSQERNHDKQKISIAFPMTPPNAWPRDSVAWLVAWFNGGCPWTREYLLAIDMVSLVNFWAFDHLALFSWPLPLPTGTSRSWQL
ncbi:MAG: hypothetical protein ABSH47_19515 [Bryobacteraceae bacterium]|jgi:hypothetical protein